MERARRIALATLDRLVVAAVAAALATVAVSSAFTWRIQALEAEIARPVVLTESTVVRHTWRAADGAPLIDGPGGTYEQPLWRYHDYSADIARLRIEVDDLKALLAVATDARKRSEARLDRAFADPRIQALARGLGQPR